MRPAPLVSALALALATPAVAQSGTLDQTSPCDNSSYNAALPNWVWQQEVVAGMDGILQGFDLCLQTSVIGDTCTVNLRLGPGWNTNPPAWTGQVGTPSVNVWQTVFTDVSSAGIALSAGDPFVIEIVADGQGMGFQGNSYIGSPGYPNRLYVNSMPNGGNGRMGFSTYIDPGPQISSGGACPGTITVDVTGATPNSSVVLVYGLAGSFTVPVGPCAGTTLDIANPVIAAVLTTDASGNASASQSVPPFGCGLTVQAVDASSCTPTNSIVL